MKRLLLTGMMLVAFGQLTADAQSKKKIKDDIYYTADDAKKEAEETEKDRKAYDEYRRKQEAENAANSNSDYTVDYGDNNGNQDEYIDYDDDDYSYSNRFNRFNSPYYGGSYWAYDPFFYDPWMMGGGGYWGRGWGMGMGPGWGMGMGVGMGGPYWSSYWGWNSWYGYPGFYNAWGSPFYGWGGWGYGAGGYYHGFYDGFYAGGYGAGVGGRNVTYGPRTSLNRYPGSMRSNATRGGGGNNTTPGQLRRGGDLGPAQNSNAGRNNYPGRNATAPAVGGRGVERGSAPSRNDMNTNERRNSFSERNYSSESRTAPARQQGNIDNANRGQQMEQQRSNRFSTQPSRSEPSYQRSEPMQQRSQPSYNAPSRSYSSPSSAPSRGGGGGGGFSGGSRGGGGGRR